MAAWWTVGAEAHRTCTPRQLDPVVAKECHSHTWGRVAIYGGAKHASCRSVRVLRMYYVCRTLLSCTHPWRDLKHLSRRLLVKMAL